MKDARPRFVLALTLCLGPLLSISCQKAPPPDPLCSYEPLPESAKVPSGQGAIQVTATTDEYFYVVDSAGKDVGHAKLNGSVAMKPGSYEVKLNRSAHTAWVKAGTLTRCVAGTLNVKGTTDEYYYVLDAGGTELSHNKLGRSLSFLPGSYTLRVNGTEKKAEIRAGETAIVETGTLVTRGSTDEYYYVLTGTGTELSHNKLDKPLAFLPGPLTISVNRTTAAAEVASGAVAEVKTGALLVQGKTDEYYYVLSATGTELAHNKLGRSLSFVEGSYTAKVNSTTLPVKVEAGKTNDYAAGTLTVRAAGTDYYYVLDGTGTELAHAKLGGSVSLAAGKYVVKVGKESRPATVAAGQEVVVAW